MNKTFWKSDWFIGVAISFIFLLAWQSGSGILEGLERGAYDSGVRMSSRDPGDRVAVVAIPPPLHVGRTSVAVMEH